MRRDSKITILSIVGLLLVALGLWGYQTFLVPAQEAEKYTNVYVASQDIPTNAMVTEAMLEAVKVNEDSIVPGSIRNTTDAVGKRTIAGILQGELIHENRLSEEVADEGDLFVQIEPDYQIDISDGDHIRIFALESDGTMNVLFERKEVYASSRIANLLEGQPSTGFYVLLDEQELKSYYSAKLNTSIVLSRIKPELTNEDIANATGEAIVFEKNESEEAADAESNNRYTVQEGQTLADVANDVNTSTEALSVLNDGMTEVKAGDVIVIP